MRNTVYRQITPVRRTPAPRFSSVNGGGLTAAFDGLLAKLTGASQRLQKSRPRRR